MTTNKTNTNILEPLVDSIWECGNLLWKLISNNPNKIDWRAEFLGTATASGADKPCGVGIGSSKRLYVCEPICNK